MLLVFQFGMFSGICARVCDILVSQNNYADVLFCTQTHTTVLA